ncbi:MAG: UDP-N-acetylmuramoyl-L-alanyl-D-glutamate--2,6-diaminopimelate ligase [Proteobacteria bacterium]|nr:UDP-N-acetylmuramoyl-L-alanyl-D-glutamate--2,6-diaminopimelate ligase [Pseudomonadota bacterium]MBU1737049.1 UDP-N-acetylmuramoyl-L-alanyl-D-glutamate--2,6-diaminopimelate ligase [Pseudomonadota bacterium]
MITSAADSRKLPFLEDVVQGLGIALVPGVAGIQLKGITADSRRVLPGFLFVAIEGGRSDGHDFLVSAVNQGCAALLVQSDRAERAAGLGVPVLVARDPRKTFAGLVAAFYGHPERELVMIGVTGTNGKTTTCYILESILKAAGFSPGVIGTVSYRYQGFEKKASLTTPEPEELFRLFRDMVDEGVTHLLMEVSSHSLIQSRLVGVLFDVAVFTNLSRDHLDFHGEMEGYYLAKRELFTRYLKKAGAAVILGEISQGKGEGAEWGLRLKDDLLAGNDFGPGEKSPHRLVNCGVEKGEVYFSALEMNLAGITGELSGPGGRAGFKTSLTGRFNLENIVVAAGAGFALGLEAEEICRGISMTGQVPGRLEKVGDGTKCRVFVDYAHTPDALVNVLETLKYLGNSRLVVVFGCGGDRDRGKRPLMGRDAASHAEVVIITSDNPRSEEPLAIMKEIEQGIINDGVPLMKKKSGETLLREGLRGYDMIESRKEAIEVVIANCRPDDVVLISGKGHEDYQIIGDLKMHFDDRQEALRCLALKY